MKGILKIVCVVLVVLCFVAKNESWWFGRRSSSRRSSSSWRSPSSWKSSSRSSRWSSRRSSSSSTTRRGWVYRGISRTRSSTTRLGSWKSNFRIPSCSYRFGTMLSSGCLKTKAGPTKAPTLCSGRFGICRKISKPKVRRTPTWPYSSCSLRVGCIPRPPPKKSRTRQPFTTSAPIVRTITRKPPAKTTSPPKSSSCKKDKENCYGYFSLLVDISNCGKHWKVTLPKPKSRARVLVKKVIEMQVVELPMGQCGSITSKGYDETTIKCLNCEGVKTSMSGKKDRVMHSGVIVKTEDGSKYLIHKRKDIFLGVKGTVIEEPNDAMYDKGYRNVGDPIEPKKLRSIKEYFKASGNGYNFMHDNCHDGTERMIKLANKP